MYKWVPFPLYIFLVYTFTEKRKNLNTKSTKFLQNFSSKYTEIKNNLNEWKVIY